MLYVYRSGLYLLYPLYNDHPRVTIPPLSVIMVDTGPNNGDIRVHYGPGLWPIPALSYKEGIKGSFTHIPVITYWN